MIDFDISQIVTDVGEGFTISGVSSSYNARGDPVESYTAYIMSGVVQTTDGSEEEVLEGNINKDDIVVFVDKDVTSSGSVKVGDYITTSVSISGVFKITSVINNPGHYELLAKKVIDLTP